MRGVSEKGEGKMEGWFIERHFLLGAERWGELTARARTTIKDGKREGCYRHVFSVPLGMRERSWGGRFVTGMWVYGCNQLRSAALTRAESYSGSSERPYEGVRDDPKKKRDSHFPFRRERRGKGEGSRRMGERLPSSTS